MTAMRLKRYPSASGGIALGKMGVGATMMKQLPYDAEVEYLESTGTQWIDTGDIPKIGDSVRMVFRLIRQPSSNYEQIMGAGSGTYQFCFPVGTVSANQPGIWCRPWQGGAGYPATPFASNSIGPNYTTDFNIKHLSGNNYRLSVGSDYINLAAMSEIDGSIEHRNLLIFRRPNVGNSWIKCYAFQLWDSDSTLVRDFIPVRFANENGVSEGAMYDRRGVGGMNPDGSPRNDGLYFNRGTGDFVIGPDINAPAI